MSDEADKVWARIIPFLEPIEGLIKDPEISDIMLNGQRGVFFEKNGKIAALPEVVISEKALQVAARNIARALGDDISEERPLLDSRLPDGSRVAITLSPISVDGTSFAIRKFQNKRYQADELVRTGTIPLDTLHTLQYAVERRYNILIAGGTGTGKTTLLNALAPSIPDEERLVLIEETSEIQIDKPNLVRLEARKEQPGLPGVSIRELLRHTLRLRPDRILVGEIRGSEAFDLLQAMNTGHGGTLSTIHANSAVNSLWRLGAFVMMAGMEIPHGTVMTHIANAVNLVVQIERRNGQRLVTEVLEVEGYDPSQDDFEVGYLYRRRQEEDGH